MNTQGEIVMNIEWLMLQRKYDASSWLYVQEKLRR